MATKHIQVMTLTFYGNVTSSVTRPFGIHVATSYRCSIVTKSLSPTASVNLGLKHIWSRPWPFNFTWRHRTRDRWTRDGSFPIGSPLDRSLYL